MSNGLVLFVFQSRIESYFGEHNGLCILLSKEGLGFHGAFNKWYLLLMLMRGLPLCYADEHL